MFIRYKRLYITNIGRRPETTRDGLAVAFLAVGRPAPVGGTRWRQDTVSLRKGAFAVARTGSRRPSPPAARRRAAQARREGVRVRAGPALQSLSAHHFPPPQGAAPGRPGRLRAPGAMGLVLRHPRRPRRAFRMADLSKPRSMRHGIEAGSGSDRR